MMLLVINLFIFLFNYLHLNGFESLKYNILPIIITILIGFKIYSFKSRINTEYYMRYNYVELLSNFILIIIFLRDIYDKNIIGGLSYSKISSFYFYSSGSLYLDYNMIFIIIIFLGLLTYNFIYFLIKKHKS